MRVVPRAIVPVGRVLFFYSIVLSTGKRHRRRKRKRGRMNQFLADIQYNLIADHRWHYLIDGLQTTLLVTVFSVIIGITFGFLLALIRSAHRDLQPKWNTPTGFLFNLANKIASIFITIIRGTPSMIQLLMMFNIFLAAVDNLPLVCILTFGLNSSAYVSEIFRAGLQSVPAGQVEAARSLGLSYAETLRKVVMPQAFKLSLPPLGNEVITLFKETSISGTIGLIDVTRGASIIITKTFQASIPYFAAALIYLFFVLLLERLFNTLEKRTMYAYHSES